MLTKLTESHEESCGWRLVSCDISFLDLQDTHPLELNKHIVQRVHDALCTIIEPFQSCRLDLQWGGNQLEWLQAFNLKGGSSSCSVDIKDPDRARQLLSLIKRTQQSMNSTNKALSLSDYQHEPSVTKGTLCELVRLHAQESSDVTSLGGLLALSAFGWSLQRHANTIDRCFSKQELQSLFAYCGICSRCVPLESGQAFDAIRQHKPYCSFIQPQRQLRNETNSSRLSERSDEDVTASSDILGYQMNMSALSEFKVYTLKNFPSKASSVAVSVGEKTINHSDDSAEHSYKKIKLVLDKTL